MALTAVADTETRRRVYRCTCHSIREGAGGVTYSLAMLGVLCGACEAEEEAAEHAYADEINARFPHGAGLAPDDPRRDYLTEDFLPTHWDWVRAVEADRAAATEARIAYNTWCDVADPWGGEPPF